LIYHTLVEFRRTHFPAVFVTGLTISYNAARLLIVSERSLWPHRETGTADHSIVEKQLYELAKREVQDKLKLKRREYNGDGSDSQPGAGSANGSGSTKATEAEEEAEAPPAPTPSEGKGKKRCKLKNNGTRQHLRKREAGEEWAGGWRRERLKICMHRSVCGKNS
jgi:hypothetical protein